MVKLCTFTTAGEGPAGARVGVVLPSGDVKDICKGDVSIPTGMRAFLDLGVEGITKANAAAANGATPSVNKSDAVLLAPISDPEKIVCIGMNYKDHCTEQNLPVPTEPVVFSKFASSIVGPGDTIVIPKEVKKPDWEVELTIVIGKKCKGATKENALEYVAGYTVAHDVSARDWQLERNGGQWLIGKTMDTFAPIGPYIVTTDELPDIHNKGIRCRINGVIKQDSNTSELVFSVQEMVQWVSQFITLKPGDLIFTGTPPGVGCFRKPPEWLKDGDVCEVEIDGIGTLSNPCKIEQ